MSDEMIAHDADNRSETFWEGHYQKQERVWSGRPNPVLVDVVEALPAGTALDLGCGEGGDAIWLAQHGWHVTAIDVSRTALKRAAASATAAGVADRVDFQQHDLARTFPAGTFDLVSAQYFHSPVEFPRTPVLQAAARAVAPGGLLLIVDHGSVAPWSWKGEQHQHPHFSSPEETLAALDLNREQWHIERLGSPEREAIGPDGQIATVTDSVIAIRRLPKG